VDKMYIFPKQQVIGSTPYLAYLNYYPILMGKGRDDNNDNEVQNEKINVSL